MDARERRRAIMAVLEGAKGPVSGSALAHEVGVSRQVVVQDIALLRARASAAGIRDIAQKGRTLRFRLAQFDFAVVSRVAGQYQKRMFVEPKSDEPAITLQLTAKEDPLQAAERFVKTYQGE